MARMTYEVFKKKIGLERVQAWARNGLTDEQLAKRIGIGRTTLYKWRQLHEELEEAMLRGKDVIDEEVENSLLKKALGGQEIIETEYGYAEMDQEEYYLLQKTETQRYKEENPSATLEEIELFKRSVSKYKKIKVKEKVREVPGDTTAMIFWLKNRRPIQWRDKQQVEHSGNVTNKIDFSTLTKKELKEIAKLKTSRETGN